MRKREVAEHNAKLAKLGFGFDHVSNEARQRRVYRITHGDEVVAEAEGDKAARNLLRAVYAVMEVCGGEEENA